MKHSEIDIVYLWVDSSCQKWLDKKSNYIGNNLSQMIERYKSNDELRYSLRSVEMFAPWIKNIFIVTDDQKPEWLDITHPKIHLIDHKDIMPMDILPCFNSNVLESNIHKIPGLSEMFLLANDDTFLGKLVSPNDFFTEEGLPIIRMMHPLKRLKWHGLEHFKIKKTSLYYQFVNNATNLVKNKYGKLFFQMPQHNIDAYLKSSFKRTVEVIFYDEFKTMSINKFRKNNDIQRIIHMYVALAENKGLLRYVNAKESFSMIINNRANYAKLLKIKPLLFCLNDTEQATTEDRDYMKRFLEEYFPVKSQFEKQN